MRARRRATDPPAAEPVIGPAADEAAARPSKTRLKQQMHALQALGERLVALSDARLAEVPIDEALRDAVVTARGTRSHEGRRRQMQYVGRLMRTADAAAIAASLAGDDADHQRQVGMHHAAEHWRDGLVDGNMRLEGWLLRFPPASGADPGATAELQRLVDEARDAKAAGRDDPKPARSLYRALHRWLVDR
jgi:ribosome-associated protein